MCKKKMMEEGARTVSFSGKGGTWKKGTDGPVHSRKGSAP